MRVVGSRLVPSFNPTLQTCYITRLIVTRYDDVVELAAATVSAAKLGDPLDADTVFGPLATLSQQTIVRCYIHSGIDEGARVVAGGDVDASFAGGSWVVGRADGVRRRRPCNARRARGDLRSRAHDHACDLHR